MGHAITHLGFHLLIPVGVARLLFKDRWWQAMVMTMIVDLDHLQANPIYDPYRRSFNFHPMLYFPAIFFYFVMTAIPKLRLIGLGLLIHMVLDGPDCIWLRYG